MKSSPKIATAGAAAFALLCAGAFWLYGPTLLFASRALFCAALVALFITDLEHRRLPNAITLPGIAVGLLFSLVTDPGWRSSLIGVAAGGGVPFAVGEIYQRVRGREGVGMGDVKMLAMIGAFLGWQGALLSLLFGSMAGTIAGLATIVLRGGNLQNTLPFGTFLAVGAVLAEILLRLAAAIVSRTV
jgi:leader peptidase (prepilin peptidase)/N-methyltransferase